MDNLDQQEIKKCQEDPVYFINKYTYKEKYSPLLADFRLYKFQEDLVHDFEKHDRILINSARQMGITSVLMSYALQKINNFDNYSVLHVNANLAQAAAFLGKLKLSYYNLPFSVKQKDIQNNKRCLCLENGSKILASSATSNSGKGFALDLVIIDNAAFISDLSDLYAAVVPTLKEGGKIIISSTLYKQGWFTDQCEAAKKGDHSFFYRELPYYVHPKKGRLWRSNQDKVLGEETAKVENDCKYYYTDKDTLKTLAED